MKLIIDAYAWVEYMEGSEKGEKLHNLLLKNDENYTLSITIAEVVSKMKRKRGNSLLAYKSINANSKIIEIDKVLANEAGLLHAEIKTKIKDFGLADAFILASAKKLNAKIITGDNHFKNFKEAIMI